MPSTEIDGLYTPWSEWSVCSDTCGNGVQIRSRSCTAPPQRNGGMDCSQFGPPVEVKQCILGQCPRILPLLRNIPRIFQVHLETFFLLLLTCEQRFLPCMDFSVHVVVRVACQSPYWFEQKSDANDFVNAFKKLCKRDLPLPIGCFLILFEQKDFHFPNRMISSR